MAASARSTLGGGKPRVRMASSRASSGRSRAARGARGAQQVEERDRAGVAIGIEGMSEAGKQLAAPERARR